MRQAIIKGWHWLRDKTEGFRALGISLALFGLDAANYFDVVDVKPALAPLFGEEKAQLIMLYAPILIGTLRFVANGNPRFRHCENAEGKPF